MIKLWLLGQNESFPNFENIPMSLTGCEQRCYCEDSTVQCQVTIDIIGWKVYTLLHLNLNLIKVPKAFKLTNKIWISEQVSVQCPFPLMIIETLKRGSNC